MYVDLGFHVYSLSDGAAKAFQLLFTVLNKKKGERINHIQARKNSIYKYKTLKRGLLKPL